MEVLIVLGLVLLLLAVYVYCIWLFIQYGVTEVILLSALLTMVAMPVLYCMPLCRQYGRSTLKVVFLPIVAFLLFSVFLDGAWLASWSVGQVRASFIQGWVQGPLSAIAFGSWLNNLLLGALDKLVPADMPGPWLIACVAGLKISLLAPLLILSRGLESARVSELGEARLNYFIWDAWEDVGEVCKSFAEIMNGVLARVGDLFKKAFSEWWAVFTGPLAIAVALGLLLPAVMVVAVSLSLLLVHSLSVGLLALLVLALGLLLRSLEWVVLRVRSRFARCPYAGCREPVPLPHFHCKNPGCSVLHTRLVPDRHGLFFRTCTCGTLNPTMYLLGKGSMKAICPKCKGPMDASALGGNLHVYLQGSPSAGKTLLFTAATWSLEKEGLSGLSVKHVEHTGSEKYTSLYKPQFEHGLMPDKTPETDPNAAILSVRRGWGLPTSLYLYDPAGEASQDAQLLQEQRVLEWYDGILFVLDPLLFPSVQDKRAERGIPQGSTYRPYEIADSINRILQVLRTYHGARAIQKRRAAVVISKGDLPEVQEAMGIKPTEVSEAGQWDELGAQASDRIKTWLQQDYQEVVSHVEGAFREVRFFLVSATGPDPRPGRALAPQGATVPLKWLLARQSALRRPLLTRLAVHLLQVAGVLLVLAPTVVIPYLLFHRALVPLWRTWQDTIAVEVRLEDLIGRE